MTGIRDFYWLQFLVRRGRGELIDGRPHGGTVSRNGKNPVTLQDAHESAFSWPMKRAGEWFSIGAPRDDTYLGTLGYVRLI